MPGREDIGVAAELQGFGMAAQNLKKKAVFSSTA
jgi:hypothetical protein